MIDNFDLLVQRCSARYRARMIRLSLFIVGTILLVLASISGYILWSSPTPAPVVQKPTQKPQKIIVTTAPVVPVQVTELNTSVQPLPNKPITATVLTPLVSQPLTPQPVVPVKSTPIPAQVQNEVIKPQNSHLFEVNTQSKTTVLDPSTTFNNSPKYETALTIARDFYTKNEFSDAAVWAKKANQMNREGEEAWLLYAKSYYAQGRKNEAIGVLELYMNYKDSKAASELLRTWKQTPVN
ncbi:MAG: CDC27 family protein [Sulfuricurvum sp.]|nr:CDC27 family protein [Sulfuricurvum sp.]